MDDRDLVAEIGRLTDEEREIENGHIGRPATEGEASRKREIEVMLDQCWDLLAQRRARREFGENPAQSEVRPPSVVENYRQ